MNDQTSFHFNEEKDSFQEHLNDMGVDINKYSDIHSIRKGKPAQGEISAISFFPKLGVGFQTKISEYRIEKNNIPDIYAIDLRITESPNQEKVGWIDVETRSETYGGDYPFKKTWCSVNIPIHSHDSNWKQRKEKIIAGKIRHYRLYPLNSFHLILRYCRNEALCMWANDILHSPIKFQKGDLKLGEDYDGRTWGQETMNILYRYSKQGDLVIDPMAGGGVTLDACLIMNRKCRAYDNKPHKKRKDIIKNDIKEGYPERCNNCSLIILDPPYHKKEEEAYDCSEFTKDRKTFLANMEKVAIDSYKILKSQGHFVLLYGQWIDYEDELKSILTFDLDRLFEKAGFRKILNIQSPLIFDNQYQAFQCDRAKDQEPWQMLPVSRDWSIFKK